MKTCTILVLLCVVKIGCIVALLCSAKPAAALGGGMETATVHSMRKVACMEDLAMAAHSVYAMAPGAVPANCVEYELRTAKVSYTIQPRHAVLLLVGGDVGIRLTGNELILRSAGAVKEVRCDVLTMALRTEAEKKEKERDRERERDKGPSLFSPRPCNPASGIETNCEEVEARR
jgi:hypothetical protein